MGAADQHLNLKKLIHYPPLRFILGVRMGKTCDFFFKLVDIMADQADWSSNSSFYDFRQVIWAVFSTFRVTIL